MRALLGWGVVCQTLGRHGEHEREEAGVCLLVIDDYPCALELLGLQEGRRAEGGEGEETVPRDTHDHMRRSGARGREGGKE